MPATPARTPKPKTPPRRTEFDDFVVTHFDDEGGTFTAKIFESETFVFSTDINAYLQLAAFSGNFAAFIEFMDSLVQVETDEDDDQRAIDTKTREEGDRFHNTLKSQKGLSIVRLGQFVADITEAAADRPTNSSSA